MRNSCKTCDAFKPAEYPQGECRFHAPGKFPHLDSAMNVMVGNWPWTHQDDWCLEWVPSNAADRRGM